MEAGQDIVGSQIGDGADGVASGKNIRQRRDSDSHNVTIQSDGVSFLRDEVMQLAVDVKLLYNMNRELQYKLLEAKTWLVILSLAMLLQSVTLIMLAVRLWR